MNKYILFDIITGLIGFYIDGIHSEIPKTAKLIDNAAYDFFLDNNGLYTIDAAKYSDAEIITKDMLVKIEHKPQIDKEPVSDLEIAFAEYVIETESRLMDLEEKVNA